jgi:hypothetical protein
VLQGSMAYMDYNIVCFQVQVCEKEPVAIWLSEAWSFEREATERTRHYPPAYLFGHFNHLLTSKQSQYGYRRLILQQHCYFAACSALSRLRSSR